MDRVEEKRHIVAAKAGDTDAFAALYRAHVQTIFRYIAFRVNDVQLAEDLTADVFARALKGLPSYEDRGRPLLAWLYRIAHGRVVDHLRRAGRRDETDLDAQPLPVRQDMDSGLMRRHAARALRVAITRLTPDQQQVIVLRFVEDRPINETAALLGKSPNAIKALQHRALRSLHDRLAQDGIHIDEILAGFSS